MKALAILQPFCFAILHLGKDVENRTWKTRFRGRFLIHASRGYDLPGDRWLREQGYDLPPLTDLPRGGIVGSAVVRDCVRASESKWFFGEFGFVLQGVKPLTFIPYRGELGFFDVPDHLVRDALEAEGSPRSHRDGAASQPSTNH